MAFTGINTAQAILKAYFQGTALTLTSAIYADLWTSLGTNTTPGTPLAYTGYTPWLLPAGSGNWTVGAPNNQVVNAVAITWGTPVPNTVLTPLPAVLQCGLWADVNRVTLLWALDIPAQYQKTFGAGDQPTLPAGALTLTLN